MASENPQFLFANELGATGVMMQHHGQSGGGALAPNCWSLGWKGSQQHCRHKTAAVLAHMQGNGN